MLRPSIAKIEGLAIRELPAGPDGRVRRELVIGLRQPDDLVRTFVADITVPPAPDAELGFHASLPSIPASARAFAVN